MTTKIIKSKRQPKNIKHTLNSFKYGEDKTHGVSKARNKKCGVCNISRKGKSNTSENHQRTVIENKNLSCNSKTLFT